MVLSDWFLSTLMAPEGPSAPIVWLEAAAQPRTVPLIRKPFWDGSPECPRVDGLEQDGWWCAASRQATFGRCLSPELLNHLLCTSPSSPAPSWCLPARLRHRRPPPHGVPGAPARRRHQPQGHLRRSQGPSARSGRQSPSVVCARTRQTTLPCGQCNARFRRRPGEESTRFTPVKRRRPGRLGVLHRRGHPDDATYSNVRFEGYTGSEVGRLQRRRHGRDRQWGSISNITLQALRLPHRAGKVFGNAFHMLDFDVPSAA